MKVNFEMFLLLALMTAEVRSASILAVTPPDRAKELQKLIDLRKTRPEVSNNVRDFLTLQKYLNHNLGEKVSVQELADAIVNGLTTAFLGKSMLVRGMVKLLQLSVGWAAALVPEDLVEWLLGRQLLVSDVIITETLIEEVFEVYAVWAKNFWNT